MQRYKCFFLLFNFIFLKKHKNLWFWENIYKLPLAYSQNKLYNEKNFFNGGMYSWEILLLFF